MATKKTDAEAKKKTSAAKKTTSKPTTKKVATKKTDTKAETTDKKNTTKKATHKKKTKKQNGIFFIENKKVDKSKTVKNNKLKLIPYIIKKLMI